MASSGTIEHLGVVRYVSDKLVKVSIIPESACGNCHAKGSCSISNTNEKIIEIYKQQNENYSVGEETKVILEQSLGLKALGLGYMLPFLVLFTILIVLTSIGVKEGVAGLLALGSLIPYYFGLSFFRDSLKKEFSFRLKKM